MCPAPGVITLIGCAAVIGFIGSKRERDELPPSAAIEAAKLFLARKIHSGRLTYDAPVHEKPLSHGRVLVSGKVKVTSAYGPSAQMAFAAIVRRDDDAGGWSLVGIKTP